jgi:2,3-bisphosphoglycerate-independent phosphoglycerate mutase
MTKKPVVLIIRDGWGINPGGKAQAQANGDATLLAKTPFHDHLYATYPRGTVSASGEDVGLPDGQMGNSEVGHLNLGAGRVVYQDLTRINKSIRDGELATMPVLVEAFEQAKGKRLHFLGLISDGGVHSHQDHLAALCNAAKAAGVDRSHGPRHHRWPRHLAHGRCGYLAKLEADLKPSGAKDRHRHRPLLRHGPRQALGAQQARLGCHRARSR